MMVLASPDPLITPISSSSYSENQIKHLEKNLDSVDPS